MTKTRASVLAALAALLLAVPTVELLAQSSGMPQSAMASQSFRPYWHVFIAYTIAIALVLGWVISIGRRLRDVEDRLGRG